MDALRFSQTLEWQPPSPTSNGSPDCPRCPKKIIFYQAPTHRVVSALGATIESMQPSKTLLLFIGADRWPYSCPSTHAQCDTSAAPAARLGPAQWSYSAKKLSDDGVTLIAPILSPSEASASPPSASARNRRPSAGCADAGFQGSSEEQNDKEGDSPASSDPSRSGPTGASPSALTAILPSVQAGPQQCKQGPARCNAPGHMLVSAPVAGTTPFADVDDVPHCRSATQPITAQPQDSANDLEGAPQLQDSAKVCFRFLMFEWQHVRMATCRSTSTLQGHRCHAHPCWR